MRLRISMFAVLVLFLAAEGLFGQEYRGSVAGRVLDPSDAAVPGAHVTLTNTATNVHFTTDTNADGHYTIPYLQPGTYSLRAEHQGFKAFERTPIEVRINEIVQVDAQLQLGSATETVNVQAATPLLDVASASAGQTIDAKRLEELPIQQGVTYHLMALTPGVVRTGTNMLDENPYDGSIISYSVGGASAGANIITVDGAATGGFAGSSTSPSFSPPQESVGELRVLTSNFDASQGFTQGANVSVSLKSGTNSVHGAAYDYGGGNGSLIANQYLNVVKGLPKSPSGPYFRRGGGVGGPVYIPKIYNGKNRTFFFLGYEGIHRTQVLTQSLTVPTDKERTGDFSDLLALGSTYQIYDPFSRLPAANGRVSSTPLPGNIVPKAQQDPIGMGLLQYWPRPNTTTGTANGTNDFYCNNSGQSNQYWGMDLRLDHNFSDRNRAYGSMHRFDRVNQDYNIFQNDVSGDSWEVHPRGGVVDDVYVISTSFIVDARIGFDSYDKLVTSLGLAVLNWTYKANGFPAYMDGLVDRSIERMPSISPSGYQGAPPGANLQHYVSETYDPSVHFTKTSGSHTMNFGWEMLVRKDNEYLPGLGATGSFNFDGTYMRGPLDSAAAAPIGQGLAQMEYGLPTSSSINRVPSSAAQGISHALYFQEDWRASRRLTVNLGMRYEFWGPTSERYNRSTEGWDPNAPLAFAAAVQANYLKNPTPEVSQLPVHGGLLFAGIGGQPHGLQQASNHDFMPRLGISYSLNSKTVVHAGYGIFFGAGGIEHQSVSQAGFSRTTTTNGSVDNGLTYTNPLSNPFPSGVLDPLGAGLGALTNVGSSITVINTHPPALYVQSGELKLDHELPGRIVVSAAYDGNRGTHLDITKNLDALPNSYLSSSPVRDQTTINYVTANIANPFYQLVPAGTSLNSNTTIARSTLLTPYPQFTGVSLDTQQGYSWYHALELTAERRFANGFTAQGSYTWSKTMGATGFLNAGDPVPTKMISSLDYPHYLALSGIYQLPIGRGRLLLGGSSKTVDSLLGGWQIEGVYRFQSGPPLGFGNALLNGSCTWKQIALPADQRSIYKEFNTSCFVTASNLQLSNNLVTMPSLFSYIRGPALSVADLSGIKRFTLRDRFGVEFRLEFLNAFNTVWMGGINTTPTSAAFGQAATENSSPRRVQWSGRLTF